MPELFNQPQNQTIHSEERRKVIVYIFIRTIYFMIGSVVMQIIEFPPELLEIISKSVINKYDICAVM